MSNLRKAKLFFRVYEGSEIRAEILHSLKINGCCSVSKLSDEFKLEQPAVSQHLSLLRKENIVETKRDGKFIFYSLNEKVIHAVKERMIPYYLTYDVKPCGPISALDHKVRQKILSLIRKEGTVNVGRIYHALKLEQSICSKHLATLAEYDFVSSHREGKRILYKVKEEEISFIEKFVEDICNLIKK